MFRKAATFIAIIFCFILIVGSSPRVSKNTDPSTRYIAHRGLVSSDYPENSLAAFEQAASCEGIWGMETDIWLTADGQFVCIHGSGSQATWHGKDVVASSLPELDGICSFTDYLAACRRGSKVAVVELKDTRFADSPELAKAAVDAVHETRMLDDCMLISFHYTALVSVAAYARYEYGVHIPTYALAAGSEQQVDDAIAYAEANGLDGVSVSSVYLPHALAKVAGTDLECGSWTYTDRAAASKAIAMGCHHVTIEFAP